MYHGKMYHGFWGGAIVPWYYHGKGEGVAEWLASRTRNREVAGSSPAFARKF
jgi:hypothetical protein